jgi:hypothetical protein
MKGGPNRMRRRAGAVALCLEALEGAGRRGRGR